MNYTRPEFWWRELPSELSWSNPARIHRWAMEEASDERTKTWLTMSSPSLNWSLTLLYVLFVWWGPKVMESRQPWDVKSAMIVYNTCIILLNAYMFFEILYQTVMLDMDWVGNSVDYSSRGEGLAAVLWLYYISKVIDYADTFFLVVKKNNHQLSFLHVYHHAFMFWVWWLGVRFAAGGDSYFSAWINCAVHVIMYGYYLGSCLGLKLRGKRHITQVQLLQFVLVITHSALSLHNDSQFPHWILWALILFLLSLLALFTNFYIRAYLRGGSSDKAKAT